MSKMVDMLNKTGPSKKEISSSMTEEIANTYFKTHGKKGQKKINYGSKMPWIVALSCLSLSLIIIFSNSKIDVRIRVLSEIPSVIKESSKNELEILSDKGVLFVRGGKPNMETVKNTFLIGDARAFSKESDDEIALCNSRGEGWANYAIELREPIDLNKLNIKYTAKGTRGDEHLVLIIVDADNRSYRMGKDLASVVTKDWQKYTINFRPIRNAVDLANISVIKFEFGSLTAGNPPSATVYLKDIYAAKTRRVKWL